MFPDSLVPESFPFEIHWYGIWIAVGLLAAFLGILYVPKLLKLNEKLVDFVFYDGIFGVMIGFGAAALFQATYNYIAHPEKGFDIKSGITFIGGLIGGALGFLIIYFIFRKPLKIRLSDILSLTPCAITVGHAFGRIGCFFAGCCHGAPTDSIFGVAFPYLHGKPNIEGIRVHPTQLYEAAFLFILCAVMTFLLLKYKFRHNMSVYLMSYGVFRFLIEFVRDDDRGSFVGSLTPSQFWSILMFVIGAALLILSLTVFKELGKPKPYVPEEQATEPDVSEAEQQ